MIMLSAEYHGGLNGDMDEQFEQIVEVFGGHMAGSGMWFEDPWPRDLEAEFDDDKLTKAQQKKIKVQLRNMGFRDIEFYEEEPDNRVDLTKPDHCCAGCGTSLILETCKMFQGHFGAVPIAP